MKLLVCICCIVWFSVCCDLLLFSVLSFFFFFFFKQKTAYEIRNCDWSSDVCSSDLRGWNWGRSEKGKREGGIKMEADQWR